MEVLPFIYYVEKTQQPLKDFLEAQGEGEGAHEALVIHLIVEVTAEVQWEEVEVLVGAEVEAEVSVVVEVEVEVEVEAEVSVEVEVEAEAGVQGGDPSYGVTLQAHQEEERNPKELLRILWEVVLSKQISTARTSMATLHYIMQLKTRMRKQWEFFLTMEQMWTFKENSDLHLFVWLPIWLPNQVTDGFSLS